MANRSNYYPRTLRLQSWEVQEIKKTEQVTKKIETTEGILKDFNDYEIKGYEIHQGVTNISTPVICKDNVFATYIHGIFDNSKFTNDLLNMLHLIYHSNKNIYHHNSTHLYTLLDY